jgi:hypothetical protein
MLAFNEQLMVRRSPTHAEVNILEDPKIMVAQKELPPLALRIVPRAMDLRLAPSDKDVDIVVECKGSETVKYKRVPVKGNLGRDCESALIIDPAEFIEASSQDAIKYDGGCVELKRVMSGVLSVPFCEYTTADENMRPKKGSQVRLECSFSYWTNEKKVPMGSAVALPRHAASS